MACSRLSVEVEDVKSSRNLLGALLFVTLLLALTGQPLQAQSEGTIQGTVLDAQGATVAGAKVTVHNLATALERSAVTDTSGIFSFPALPAGNYRIEIRKDGFQTLAIGSFTLDVATVASKNYTLQIGQVAETMEVTTEAPVVEAATMTVGHSIDQKTVQEIPLNGRHFVDLGLLIPGSVTPPQNGFLTAPLRGQGSFAINTAGNREDTVNFMVNGINLNDMVQNQITFQPSINTVSEFRVDNSTYSAEYGRNSGAIVNIATRSGTNSYHGELFEFLRNHDFDARNFFNPAPALQSPFKRNQFGANFGGPIRKDKTFFFLSYEGLRQRQGITINTQVLTDANRQLVTTTNNPTSVQLLGMIPPANDATRTRFLGSATAPVNIDQGTADISHNLTRNVRLHAYYAGQHDLRQEPTLQGNSLPGFGDTRESKRQIATFSVDQIFSTALVNEARIGFNRIHITFTPNSLLNPVSLGIQDGNNFNAGLPQTSIGGTGINFGGPGGFPQGRGDTTAVISDTLNYLRGRHSFKFGGEFRRFYNNNFNGDAGTLTFLNVTQFANGTPNGFAISPGSNPSRISTGELGFFGMDNWKVFSRFTLELGLRYDWNQTPTEALNRFANFIPTTNSLVVTSSPYQQNNKNFEPRVGFAWDLFGAGKTILRAGYGLLTDQPITNLITGLTGNPPFGSPVAFIGGNTTTTTYANVLSAAKAGGLAPIAVAPNFKNSYIQSYNLNIQQQLTSKLGLMAGYFASKGTDLRTRVNLNQFVSGVRPFPTLSASSPIDPGGAIGNISDNVSIGNSTYNALWLTSNLNVFHGLQFNASYTYSKSLDWTSQNGQGVVIQNSLNPAGDKGLSDFDARHRFVMNFLYGLPFKGNRLVEGWQLGSIIQDQSGNPLNLVVTGVSGLTGLATLRPDLIGPVQIVAQPVAGGIQWFTPSLCDPTRAFSPSCSGATFSISTTGAGNLHFGSLGRNAIIGPGFNNVDFSLIKRTKISERFANELRIEAFDLFNHPNFGQPGRGAQLVATNPALPVSATNPLIPVSSFGVISSTRFPVGDSGSARQLQFAVKLIF
jgi:carboxypeptidase family protein